MQATLNQPQRVTARRVEPAGPDGFPGVVTIGQPTTLEQDLAIARTVARLMDSQFEIAGIRFGLDAAIGLVPVVGDAVAFAIGMYPIHLARKHGLGKWVISRMLMNLGIDFVVGLVPVVGDAADVLVKANLKNVRLLEQALASRESKK